MINELQDVSIKTMIGQLPYIINKNNDIIEQNFDNIYDSSLNKIIKPVDTTQNEQNGNYVKSHTGNFLNIICDNIVANKITVQDIIIEGEVKSDNLTNHDSLGNRFKYKELVHNNITNIGTSYISSTLRKYSHNAGAIGVQLGGGRTEQNGEGSTKGTVVKSLQEILNDIFDTIGLYTSYQHYDSKQDYVYDSSGNKVIDYIDPSTGLPVYKRQWYNRESKVHLYGVGNPNNTNNELLNEPDSFTFDNNVLFASNIQLKRMNLPQYQYDDIKSGNLFTYYDYSPVITINDEHTASLKGTPGTKVKIKFKDLKKKAYYRIILSRKDKKYLRISKDELLRLNLICESTDDVYGTIWDVDTYCVRHPEDLIIETK